MTKTRRLIDKIALEALWGAGLRLEKAAAGAGGAGVRERQRHRARPEPASNPGFAFTITSALTRHYKTVRPWPSGKLTATAKSAKGLWI
jgi:hypothetical protein